MNKRDLQRFKKLIDEEKQKVLQKLGMIEEEGIYRIVSYEEAAAARRTTRTVYLEDAQAADIKKTLEQVVSASPDGALMSISSNDAANVLILSGPDSLVQEMFDLALELDFAEPTLPDESLYPRRIRSTGIFFAATTLLFGIASLMVAAIREHTGF